MQVSFRHYLLEFIHPFGVSSNTRKHTDSIFLKLEDSTFVGYGEACLPNYLGESVQDALLFLEKAKLVLLEKTCANPIPEILVEIDQLLIGNNAAKAAIDIALHDLYAKKSQQSFRQMIGLETVLPRATSFTIGIDSEEVIAKKIEAASEFSVLKIKAGTSNDKQLIQLIRKYTDKPLYVDVNQGWSDKKMVLEMAYWMHEQGVILLEQPMPIAMKEETKWVTEQSPLFTIADESVKRLSDLEKLEGTFHGINIKLMKCTGLAEAMKMIAYCKEHNLKILLGCMAESSCATSAMGQLMNFADYVDLDAPKLYKNDPFIGLEYENGKVYLNDRYGIGVEPILNLFD